MYMNGVFFIIMASPNRILNLSQLNTSIPLLASMLMLTTRNYSLSPIVQITDFLDFLYEYCEEKSETLTEF